MTEDFEKTVAIDEPDPQKIAERKDDPPGSFLDMYRSLSSQHIPQDETFVNSIVIEGVIPETIRYGVMNRGTMHAYRGVVKSTQGDLYYFNWHDGAKFKLVPANDDTKVWEANKLFKSCQLGCDLIRSNDSAPITSGEPVDPPEEEEASEDIAKDVPAAAVAAVSEEQFAQDQERMLHERHPGAAGTQTADDPTQGRDWHAQETLARAQDGMDALASNDGEKHWTTADLLKSWGQQMQQTAPRVLPRVSALESEYMQTVLNVPHDQIQKGMLMTPRHRHSFEEWKASRLRGRLAKLSSWSSGNGTT
jgi:hypothetical protein